MKGVKKMIKRYKKEPYKCDILDMTYNKTN